MPLSEIETELESIAQNPDLFEEINFAVRVEAIDYIEFHIIDRIDSLNKGAYAQDALEALKVKAIAVKESLEKVNDNLFQFLYNKIKSGNCRGSALRSELEKYLSPITGGNFQEDEDGYDNLDILVNGIFSGRELPSETLEREPEMVFYQKTPVRIIFELAEKANFKKTDVLYDLGSGLGQVSILINLLTGVICKGVEFEPAFCSYATAGAAYLNLENVTFTNADARSVSYADGTMFFMYTPFTGRIMEEVLTMLYRESQKRTIRIFTYGPCTLQVAMQSWLTGTEDSGELHEFKSPVF